MLLIHQCHARNNDPFQILASDDDDDEDTAVASNCSPRLLPQSLPPSDNPRIPPARPCTRQVANQPTNPPSTLQLSCPPEAPSPRVLTIPSNIMANTPTAPHVHIHDLQPTPPRTHSKPPTIVNAQPTLYQWLNLIMKETRCLPKDQPPPTPLHLNHYKSNPMQHFTPSIVSCHWAGMH